MCKCKPAQFNVLLASKLYGVNATIIIFVFVLYCFVLYCIVLYCIVLFCIVLYCFVLYCIVLFCIDRCLKQKLRKDGRERMGQ